MIISYPILSAFLGLLIAQVVKIPIHYIYQHEWRFRMMFRAGGMPSSHTAFVISLSTAIGLTEGIQSSVFAVCVVLSAVVMYDATGVRRHAGFHAEVLNDLVEDFDTLSETVSGVVNKDKKKRERLKEILGHKPSEVFFGILTGVIVAIIIYFLYPF